MFTANWKQPNLTKLTTNRLGRNVGKKPTQSRHSQRKAKPPILARTVHSGLSSEPTCVTVSASRFPMQGISTTSTSDVSHIYQPPFVFAPDPWWNMYSHSSSAANMPFPTFTQNYSGSYNTLSAYNSPSFSVNYGSSPTFTVSHPSDYCHSSDRSVFWVFKLNKCITTCYGCRNKFTRAADGGLPIPPLDLILKCNEDRQYYDKAGTLQEKEKSNTYYHPSVNCIKKKHPDFQLNDIRLDDSVRSSLHSSHFELLQSVFDLSF